MSELNETPPSYFRWLQNLVAEYGEAIDRIETEGECMYVWDNGVTITGYNWDELQKEFIEWSDKRNIIPF